LSDPLDALAEDLFEVRRGRAGDIPTAARTAGLVDDLLGVVFPQRAGEREFLSAAEVRGAIEHLGGDLRRLLRPWNGRMPHAPEQVVTGFLDGLPDLVRLLRLDAEAILSGDPAAENLDEVVAAYPGFLAIAVHRVAHALYEARVPVFPRLLAEQAHVRTGIDIHPGATIGERFCIDHGTGVVIGESAILGADVKVYQGVSLGALSVSKGQARTKRHPTVEDRVVLYSNATVLGGKTVIGHDSIIGGNVWLTESVPPFSVLYHRSEIKVRSRRPLDDGYVDFQI
jgi:serine O-acetyltransferase